MAEASPTLTSPGSRFAPEEDAELLRCASTHIHDDDCWNILADMPFFQVRRKVHRHVLFILTDAAARPARGDVDVQARGRLAGHLMKRWRALKDRERAALAAAQMQLLQSQVSLEGSQAATQSSDAGDGPRSGRGVVGAGSDTDGDTDVVRAGARGGVAAHVASDGESDASMPRRRVARKLRAAAGVQPKPAGDVSAESGSSSSSGSEPSAPRPSAGGRRRLQAAPTGRARSQSSSSSSSSSESSPVARKTPSKPAKKPAAGSAARPASSRRRATARDDSDASPTSESSEPASSATDSDAGFRRKRRRSAGPQRQAGAVGKKAAPRKRARAAVPSKRRQASSESDNNSAASSSADEDEMARPGADAEAASLQRLVDPQSGCAASTYVHKDDDGRVFSVSLEKRNEGTELSSQVDGGKVAFLQLLVRSRKGGPKLKGTSSALQRFSVWSKWGRAGSSNPGSALTGFNTLEEAIARFTKSYYDKTGNDFYASEFIPKPGMYTLAPQHAAGAVSSEYPAGAAGTSSQRPWRASLHFPGLSPDATSPVVASMPAIRIPEEARSLFGVLASTEVLAATLACAGIAADKLNVGRLPPSFFKLASDSLKAIGDALGGASAGGLRAVEKYSTDFFALVPSASTDSSVTDDDRAVNTPVALMHRTAALHTLELVNRVASAMQTALSTRSRSMHPVDQLYLQLRWLPHPLNLSSSAVEDLQILLRGTQDPRCVHAQEIVLVDAFELHPASPGASPSGASPVRAPAISAVELPNRQMLWWALPNGANLAALLDGPVGVSTSYPAAGFPFGRGEYFTPVSTAAALQALGRSPWSVSQSATKTSSGALENGGDGQEAVLVLCEVSCGRQHVLTQRQAFSSLPPRCHSIHVSGRRTVDPSTAAPWSHASYLGKSAPLSVLEDGKTPAAPTAWWGPVHDSTIDEAASSLDSALAVGSVLTYYDRVPTAADRAKAEALYDADVIMDMSQVRPRYAVRVRVRSAGDIESASGVRLLPGAPDLHPMYSQQSVMFSPADAVPGEGSFW